jgi:hypothetical protein
LARQQVALLASACEDPDRRISALELSSAAGSAEDRRARLRRRVHRGTAAASSGGSRA